MKTIGLIGGMSLESVMEYYRIINATVRDRLGSSHTAHCLISSVDCHNVEQKITAGEWRECALILAEGAKRLEQGGADFILLCTSTLHRVADDISRAVSIPLLHIADVTRDDLLARGMMNVGLIGTNYTTEEEFNKSHLTESGIKVRIPPKPKRDELNRIIFEELYKGIGKDSSREFVLKILADFARQEVDAVVMGSSEIGILVDQEDSRLPLIDTMRIHATRAAELSLEDGKDD